MTKRKPRSEARPIPWEDLTSEQQRAATDAVELLKALVSAVQHRREDMGVLGAFLPTIERTPHNMNILLDGGRGSGKTTVFLTILNALVGHWTGEGHDFPPSLMSAQTKALVPLDNMYLHAERSDMHLTLVIAERFRRVVDAIAKGRSSKPPFHPARGDGGYERLDRAWRRFYMAAAAGANLKARQGNLDPEDFAEELTEATSRYSKIAEAYAVFIDELVSAFHSPPGEGPFGDVRPPLFIIPIDDADMHVETRTLELLHVLFTMSHPHVSFLMTGDTNLFLSVLRVHYDENVPNEKQTSSRLAAEFYRRVMPPTHRCALPPLQQRLEPKLETQLAAITVDSNTHMLMLFKEHEQLCEALPDRIRWREDLILQLRHETTAPELVQLLWEQWLAHDADERPDDGIVHDLMRCAPHQGLQVEGRGVSWHTRSARLYTEDHFLGPRFSIEFRRPLRLDATVERNGKENRLPRPLVAALLLGCNVAALHEDSGFVDAPPLPTGFEPWYAVVTFESESLDRELEFAWPMPQWPSFRDMARFSTRWGNLFRAKESTIPPFEELARWFLKLVFDVATNKPEVEGEYHEAAPGWSELKPLLSTLAVDPRKSYERWARARFPLLSTPEAGLDQKAAAELLAVWRESLPTQEHVETSMSESQAEQVGAGMSDVLVLVMAERRRHHRYLLGRIPDLPFRFEEALKSVEADLDQVPQREPWQHTLLHFNAPTVAAQPKLSIRTALDAIHVKHPEEGFTFKAPSTLAGYLTRQDYQQLSYYEQGITGPAGTKQALEVVKLLDESPRDATEALHEVFQSVLRSSAVRMESGRLWVDQKLYGRSPDTLVLGVESRRVEKIFSLARARVDSDSNVPSALLKVAACVAADEQDCEPALSPSLKWLAQGRSQLTVWDGTGCWMVPAFPSIYDWEALDTWWWDTMDRVRDELKTGFVEPQQVMDELAYQWIRAVTSVVQRHEPLGWQAPTRDGRSAKEWAEVVERAQQQPPTASSASQRWAAYERWAESLVMLAAPPAGLSTEAARHICQVAEIASEKGLVELYEESYEENLRIASEAVLLNDDPWFQITNSIS